MCRYEMLVVVINLYKVHHYTHYDFSVPEQRHLSFGMKIN